MRSRLSIGVVTITASMLVFALTTELGAQGAKPSGGASPQEVVAILQQASNGNNMLAVLPVISPNGLKVIANEGVTGLLMVLAFSDPDDGLSKPSKSELESKRKQYRAAVDLSTQTLKPYGLDALIGKPVLAAETQNALDAALDRADKVVLITSLYGSLMKIGPLLGIKKDPKPEPLVKIGAVSDYKLNGDKATAQNNAETIEFSRINGRWYVEPPASKGGGGSGASTASAGSAGQGSAPPAPRATASGKEPEIAVGGVQTARVVVADDDFSAKPFNSDNGTKIVLWVKMPAGQGLIEIDDDASLLQSVTDDKGSNIGGKFESFPDEFKDGSGGTIEIQSSGFAASGATAILAEGSLAMTVAAGTRKTRVAKVPLQNDAKFTFDKTPIVVGGVEAQDDSQSFTLKLPRQVMAGIKNVVFLDAKGQPIEGRRTGSGYMNEAAEMSFSVKTAAKVVTIEFESWQGLRTIKVPFKVRAGLGL